MDNSSEMRTARRLGIMEAGSAAFHLLGLYRCVIVSARYNVLPNTSPNEAILAAIGNLIHENPMLRVGIRGEGSTEAYFTHIPEMKLSDFVEFRTSGLDQDHENFLEDVHCEVHDQFWQNVETRPPWRVVVCRPDGAPSFEDVVFAFHHSLTDGVGGKLFHEKLLTQLNSLPSSPSAPEMLSFPEPPTLPEPQDNIIDYTTTWSHWAAGILNRFRPSFLTPAKPQLWTGGLVDFNRHKTRLHTVYIPPAVVSTAVAESRTHGASITALLHTLVLTSLSRRLPDAPAFESTTPMSMRPYIPPRADPSTKEALVVCVTGMTHPHSSSAVTTFRAAKGDMSDLIWEYARKVKNDIKKRSSTLPADEDMSDIAKITDWLSFLGKKDGKKRARSWEVSNVGNVVNPEGEGEEGKRTMSRMLFTNGVMVSSDPMSISVASVKNGPLALGITWNEGIVEDKVMEGLARDLETYLTRLHETGTVTDEL
ncbi:hypothetical protein F53441_7183 [Fusarium austroafricanum]|uniref:Alcohol acetyltransferase FCK4 n=1 Tax=Fusarium austroafricanum TaxID=2364996 RepID=A0A8H4KGC4_9HYPO|nr:hypothetical protein F53441_7183 [Fusarium austroafricanum]